MSKKIDFQFTIFRNINISLNEMNFLNLIFVQKFYLLLIIFFLTAINIFSISKVDKLDLLNQNEKIVIGFVINDDKINEEENAAFSFIKKNKLYNVEKLVISKINETNLEKFDIIWIHKTDTIEYNDDVFEGKNLNSIRNYINNGGSLFLTLDALYFLPKLGLEKNLPQNKYINAVDDGYGRKLGLHSFKYHPIFNKLNGGAYIFNPYQDTIVRQIGYFDEIVPEGNVIAVDWSYITLEENSKLVLEYNLGKGKVLAIGAYTYFSVSNYNREYLELFIDNCLNYLDSKHFDDGKYYWDYSPLSINEINTTFSKINLSKSKPWNWEEKPITLCYQFASDDWYDINGQRILIMGKEKNGISEIWTHPFMAFRDYEVGVQFSFNDSIYWFKNFQPRIEINPEGIKRVYKFSTAYITEIITASIENPIAAIHYEYRGIYPAKIFIKFTTNLRLMWPYSQNVTGKLKYDWNENLNTFIVQDRTGDLNVMLGSNKVPEFKIIGQYDDFINKDNSFNGIETDEFKVSGLLKMDLKMNDNFDIVISGTNEGIDKTVEAYKYALQEPQNIYLNTINYYNKFLDTTLIVISPDPIFNKGYLWSLIGTEKFFVNTPQIGKSLVAGYATTAKGWNGNHKISGRPGYAWYFGRDGVWSGFALLDYGDFQKVKDILKLFQKYQDINGKIFHELTTSGVVHYDAADATPLYIILAGKYLRQSGDIDFIQKSWGNIKKAIDFCFSTDTDGDHLIENKNVGHGWVEGGALYGSSPTFYLAGSWAKALEEASFMANTIGKKELAENYKKEAQIVKKIINNEFWNDGTQFFNYGKLPNATYNKEITVLPSVPIYFEIVDTNKAIKVIDNFAYNSFTTNWGVRILKDSSPLFNPNGYHYGSVWPLFTGWAALSEYKYGNYVQGFTHIMNNLRIYKFWAKGFIEEVLNGEKYKPSGVCSHQCWSETMVLQPIIEGMLGLKTDAINNSITFSPYFLPNWDSIVIKNIKIGQHKLNFKMIKNEFDTKYYFHHSGDSKLNINFSPIFSFGTYFENIFYNGKPIKLNKTSLRNGETIMINFEIDKEAEIEIKAKGGISVLPYIQRVKPNYDAKGFRFLKSSLNENNYIIEVEGIPNTEEVFEVYSPNPIIKSVDNGSVISYKNNIYSIKVTFEKSKKKYLIKNIKLNF